MGNKRREREAQYQQSAAPHMLSHDLIWAAVCALRAALDERRGEVLRNRCTHASSNALGAVILFATSIDVALTEVITWDAVFAPGAEAEVQRPPKEKYMAVVGGAAKADLLEELSCLSDVRDELIHYLPRYVHGIGNVPEWFRHLHDRGYFIVSGHEPDFAFSQKLASYALGYWAARTAHAVAMNVLDAAPPVRRIFVEGVAHNFGLYSDICPPERLSEYDAENGLTLTPTPLG